MPPVNDLSLTLAQGCNIPDIEIVVQWKLPDKLSSFIQHTGWAARGPNTKGLTILLCKPAAYSVSLSQTPMAHGRTTRTKKKHTPLPKKESKAYIGTFPIVARTLELPYMGNFQQF